MSSKRQLRFQPCVQILEDRVVPATFTVKNLHDTGSGSLRQAILDANATTAADTIVFKDGLEGTILLASGEITITNNLSVIGPGASKVAVSGNFSTRIFKIENDTGPADLTVTLKGLELRHGKSAGNGGAVLSMENLTLTKMVCTFNQSATTGGAIHCAGHLTVVKSMISGNSAGFSGGGIYSQTTATIKGSTIAGNSAGFGGGISWNTATITGSTIAGNTAANNGGGIIATEATIAGCTITGNTAGNHGGGIFSEMAATISGSTIAGNTANKGGGVFLNSSTPDTFRNSTISGNRATIGSASTNYGGGIYSGNSDVVLQNCTIAFNQAGVSGGGISGFGGTITLTSTIVALNGAPADVDLDSTTTNFQADHCLIGDQSEGANFHDNGGNLLGSTGSELDPLLAPLANNGGRTSTHKLKKGSPAINAGTNPSPAEPFDQRGAPFKRKLGPAADIGAFERQ